MLHFEGIRGKINENLTFFQKVGNASTNRLKKQKNTIWAKADRDGDSQDSY